jgi:hypothetical protein
VWDIARGTALLHWLGGNMPVPQDWRFAHQLKKLLRMKVLSFGTEIPLLAVHVRWLCLTSVQYFGLVCLVLVAAASSFEAT